MRACRASDGSPSSPALQRDDESKGFRAGPRVFNLAIRDGLRVRYLACNGERASLSVHDCSRNWRYDRA